ncbi:MAG: prephenate dehydrogenase/arogenate dehydrogenase family protein [Desulfobacterales bacterium]
MSGPIGVGCTVGIVGFGRFGRLTAKYLAADFRIKVCSGSAAAEAVSAAGAELAGIEEAARCDIVLPAVPISRLQEVLAALGPRLRAGSLVVDVCSVKEQPVGWMQAMLPAGVDILGTHPMFGPDSAADSLAGRKIVLCPVRIAEGRLAAVRAYLEAKGLAVILATPEEHDRQIAVSLALTHFIGRALARTGARPMGIDTEGYRRLLRILEVVENDTWQLFEDMQCYNPHSRDARRAFMGALREIEAMLPEPPHDSSAPTLSLDSPKPGDPADPAHSSGCLR